MPTRIASTFLPSSSVVASVKCSLSRELDHLVVAKLNSLQVYSVLDTELQLECNLQVRGIVRLVRAIPIQDSSRSNLLVLLDHPDPEVLILNYTEGSEPGSGKLNLKHQIPLDERGSRPAEFCTDAIVHPSGMFAVVSCYAGRLKAITIEDGEVHNLQLTELNLLSFALLPLAHEDLYSIALLYIDHKEHVQLVARDLRISTDGGAELDNELSTRFLPTSISLKNLPIPHENVPQLIPIPANDYEMDDDDDDDDNTFLGGVLVVGGSKILLYELSSQEVQEKQKGKRKRDTQKRKSDADSGKNKREIKRRNPSATVDWPWSRVSAWTALDESSEKILVGDAFGRLAMLSLTHLRNLGMILIPLGEISPATTLSYLTNQVTFVGSHLGDSQVVYIRDVSASTTETLTLPIPTTIVSTSTKTLDQTDGKGKGPSTDVAKGCVVATKGSYIDVLQTFKNIAPISDAVLVDLDGSGQVHIVTCSGGGNTGSVNIVRIGADFEELASMPGLEHTINLWPLKISYSSLHCSHFVTTSILQSHVFQINSADEVRCVDGLHDFVLDHQTLYIGNMAVKKDNVYGDSSLVVQVTPSAIYLFKHDDVLHKWELEHKQEVGSTQGRFLVASGNASQVLVAQAGGWIHSFTVQFAWNQKYELKKLVNAKVNYSMGLTPQESASPDVSHPWYNTEISAINCPVLDPMKYFGTFVAAAFWHTNQVKLYSLIASNGIEFLCQTPSLSSPVRSIILHYMTADSFRIKDKDSHLCLFAGLADGSVVTFEMVVNEESGATELKDMSVASLGQLPVTFSAYETGGKRVVVATGSRAVVFSWERSHLRAVPVMLKDIISAKVLNTEHYPNSLILATTSGISIGRVKNLEKMHIRSASLGLDNPRHIVYAPTSKLFGLGCVRTEPVQVGQDETVASSFKLLDDTTLGVLAQVDLQNDEHIMSLAVLNVTVNDKLQPLFCVGTTFLRNDEMEPSSGRILLFEPTQPSPTVTQLRRVASDNVSGCVYSLAVIDGMLAAAINSSVSLYRVTCGVGSAWVSIPDYTLEKVADWNHNYLVNAVSSCDEHLVVSDQFSSVSLLKLDADCKLSTVAKDYSPLCPISIDLFDTAHIIGADQSLNIFTFSLGNVANRAVLKRDGFFHVGDLVTKFIRGSISSSDAASERGFDCTHIFCTLSGQIGVVITVHSENEILSETLCSLETQLGLQKSDVVGGISHARHRAPRSSRGRSDADEAAYGILDGDLLEQMITHMETTPEVVEAIYDSDEFSYSLTELKKDLEVLHTMH